MTDSSDYECGLQDGLAKSAKLLAALQSMVNTFQYAIDDQTGAQEDAMVAALKLARATIAKATL